MYSRYMRSGGLWEDPEQNKTPPMPSFVRPAQAPIKKEEPKPSAGVSSLLKGMDSGDILLIAIILFLLVEGDDIELIITLGLLLLGGI